MIFYQNDNSDTKQLTTDVIPSLTGNYLKLWDTQKTSPDFLETLLNSSPYLLSLPNQQATIDLLNSQIASLQSQVTSLQAVANIRPPIVDLNLTNIYKDVACTQLAVTGDTVRAWKSGSFTLTCDSNNLLTSNGLQITRTMRTQVNIPKNRTTIEIEAYTTSIGGFAELYGISLSGASKDFVRLFNATFGWIQYASDGTQIANQQNYVLTTANTVNKIKILKDYDTLSLYANNNLVGQLITNKLQLTPDVFNVGNNNATPNLYLKSLKIWDYPKY